MKSTIHTQKPYAANPHVRFAEGEVALEKPKRGSLLYKLLHIPRLSVAASLLAFAARVNAADLTVEQGSDPVTVTENSTYDAVVVNGDLTVAPGVTLSCTSLTVADNIAGTAKLVLGDGATVTVTGASATKIGVGSGRAEVYLGTDAKFNANSGYFNFCYGYDSAPASDAAMTEALLVVGTNATIKCNTDFCFGHDGNGNNNKPSSVGGSAVKAVVRLDEGAEIQAQRINDMLPVSEQVLFNGGRIVQRTTSSYTSGFVHMPYAAKKSEMNLEGTNGCPISFHLVGVGKHPSFASFGSSECRIYLKGDGGFLKTGAAAFPLINSSSSYWSSSNPNLRFLFTGDFVIREGGFSVATEANDKAKEKVFRPVNNSSSRPVDLVVEDGAVFDLAGVDSALNSIKALGGTVTNSADASATLTIGVLDDGRGSILTHVNPGIGIVKTGDATLTLGGTDSNVKSLDVQEGTLVMKDTPRMGYPFYRFQIDGHKAGIDSNQRVRVCEFAFMTGSEDVTRPYKALHYDLSGTSTVSSPENMLDGDLTTQYYDMRASSPSEDKRAKVGVTVEYADCQPVDSYRWAPYESSSSTFDPTAWRVFGGYSKDNLTLLDQVTGFTVTDVVDGWNATNFVCSYSGSSALHVGTLQLANGAQIVAAGAQVSCDTFAAASGLELDLANGATVPLTAAQSVSKISVSPGKGIASVSVLNPELSGALHVTGTRQALKGALLLVGSCENAGNLAAWSVYHNGEQLENRRLCFEHGEVRLLPIGFTLSFR